MSQLIPQSELMTALLDSPEAKRIIAEKRESLRAARRVLLDELADARASGDSTRRIETQILRSADPRIDRFKSKLVDLSYRIMQMRNIGFGPETPGPTFLRSLLRAKDEAEQLKWDESPDVSDQLKAIWDALPWNVLPQLYKDPDPLA